METRLDSQKITKDAKTDFFKQEVTEVTEKLFGNQRSPGGGESFPLCCLPFLLFKTSVFVSFVISCEILCPWQLLSFLQDAKTDFF